MERKLIATIDILIFLPIFIRTQRPPPLPADPYYYPYHSRPHKKHLVLKVLGFNALPPQVMPGSQGFFRRMAPGLVVVHNATTTDGSLYAAMAAP